MSFFCGRGAELHTLHHVTTRSYVVVYDLTKVRVFDLLSDIPATFQPPVRNIRPILVVSSLGAILGGLSLRTFEYIVLFGPG